MYASVISYTCSSEKKVAYGKTQTISFVEYEGKVEKVAS